MSGFLIYIASLSGVSDFIAGVSGLKVVLVSVIYKSLVSAPELASVEASYELHPDACYSFCLLF